MSDRITRPGTLKEVASVFLKLGVIGFGGPAAHISLMQREIVERRKWITEEHFLDLIGATNLIPGPNSTEMAIHIGKERAGLKGLIVAGICFIIPAVWLTFAFAFFYKEYGALPNVKPFLYGIKPAIIAIVIGAVIPLAKKSLKSVELYIFGIVALVLALFRFSEILIMFGAGLIAILLLLLRRRDTRTTLSLFPILALSDLGGYRTTNFHLFLIFLKIGAILYGSGYVLFAFLDTELVATGLLTRAQLIDAIAVGQFTPGPVFSSVTFIGYLINGLTGAIISTIAIFLPSFVFVAILNPLVRKMRGSVIFSTFLDAVNVASVAIIMAVSFEMGKDAITEWRTAAIAILSFAFVFKTKINSALLVAGASALGYFLSLV